MKKRYLATIIPLVLLSAGCTNSSTKAAVKDYTVTGKAEMGISSPQASTCSYVPLNGDLKKAADVKPTKFKLDASGNYSITAKLSKYVQLTCGVSYKMDKTDPATKKGTITAIGDVTKSPLINMNIGTTIEADDIKTNYKKGAEYSKVETAIREKLFSLAKIKDPKKDLSLLTTKDPSLNGLQEWLFGVFRKNKKAYPESIINDLKSASLNAKAVLPPTLQLPDAAIALPTPDKKTDPTDIGVLDEITINQQTLDFYKGKELSMQQAIAISVPNDIITVPADYHMLLQGGNNGSLAVVANSASTGYAIADIRSLFNPTGTTTFTLCVVDKDLASCDGTTPEKMKTFDLKGKALPTLGTLTANILVNKHALNDKGVISIPPATAHQIMILAAGLNDYDINEDSLLLAGEDGATLPLETVKRAQVSQDSAFIVTDQVNLQHPENVQGYGNTDINSLLNPLGESTLTLCIVAKGVNSCPSAADADRKFSFKVEITIAPSTQTLGTLVGHAGYAAHTLTTRPMFVDPAGFNATSFSVNPVVIKNPDPNWKGYLFIQRGLMRNGGVGEELPLHRGQFTNRYVNSKEGNGPVFSPLGDRIVTITACLTMDKTTGCDDVAADQKQTFRIVGRKIILTPTSTFAGTPFTGSNFDYVAATKSPHTVVHSLWTKLAISIDAATVFGYEVAPNIDHVVVTSPIKSVTLKLVNGKYTNPDLSDLIDFSKGSETLTVCVVSGTTCSNASPIERQTITFGWYCKSVVGGKCYRH